MNRKTLAILSITAVAVVVVVLFVQFRESSRFSAQAGAMLFPDLDSRLDDVSRVELRRGTADSGITLIRTDSGWGVEERGGYPAKNASIQRLLLGLTRMQLVSAKTSDPQKHARLAVGDPAQDASARLVRLLDRDSKLVAEIILGNTSRGDGQYLRKPGDPQSWRGSEKLSFGISHSEWLDRDLLRINQAEITESHIQPVKGPAYKVLRSADVLTLEPAAPDGMKNKPGMLNRLQSVMQNLQAEDIWLKDTPADGWATAAHTLQSGLVVTLRSRTESGDAASNNGLLRISVDSPATANAAAQEQAAALQARLHGHVYEIPAHQARMMGQSYDNVVEEIKTQE